MKYVIRWGKEWAFETIPLHKAEPVEGEPVYCSKEAALNAAITEMHHAKKLLGYAIVRAEKKQRMMDRRYVSRSDAVLSRYA